MRFQNEIYGRLTDQNWIIVKIKNSKKGIKTPDQLHKRLVVNCPWHRKVEMNPKSDLPHVGIHAFFELHNPNRL